MISKHRAQSALVVIFTMTLFFTMITVESAEFEQTRHIGDTTADSFVTELGIGFDADLVTVLDPNMDITAYLFFHDIKINGWEVLHNATLRLRTASSLDFDADSSITIYGTTDYSFFGPGTQGIGPLQSPAAILSAPLTSSSVTVNTSQFYGPGWKEIDVSVLVNEMKNNANFDGPGMDRNDPGDNMAFIILGAEGSDIRYFYDYRAANNYEAQLVLHWTTSPPLPGASFNESHRGLNIFVIDHNGENRTGEGFDLNWNNLNMTMLTEQDGGNNDLILNSDTWLTVTTMLANNDDSMYNDTGAPANITSFFVRFAINVTMVNNGLGGGQPDRVFDFASVSTATPVGGGGLLDGGVGDQAGLFMYLDADDVTWRFRLIERSGAAFSFDGSSAGKLESDGNIYYVEFVFVDDGVQSFIQYRSYSDPLFQNILDGSTKPLIQASGPMRYPKIASALSAGASSLTAQVYTFLDFELPENKTWVVAYENGTIITDDCPSYECAITFIDVLLGPDPEDPTPPSQGWDPFGPFSRFSTRLYIFLIGVFLIFGPLVTFASNRPSGYEFTIGAFIMLVGFALMYAAGQV